MTTKHLAARTRTVALAAGALFFISTGSPVFADTVVSQVSSSAYGLDAKAGVLNAIGVEVGPLAASAGGSAPPAYTSSAQVGSVNQALALGTIAGGAALSEGIKTGIITSSASSPFTGTAPATSTATATVNGLALSLATSLDTGFPLGTVNATLLSLGANTITSTTGFDGTALTTQSGVEGLTGSSTITGLNLSLLGVNQVLTAATGPNAVLFNLANVIKIVSNEQILTLGNIFVANGHQYQTSTLTTNALHITLGHTLFDGSVVNSDVIVSSSTASFTRAVPEASTWAMMIIGFGGVGFSLRSSNRRKRAKTGTDFNRLQAAV